MPGFFRAEFSMVSRQGGTGKAAAKLAYIMRTDVADLNTGEIKHPASREDDFITGGIVFPEHLSEKARERWRDFSNLAYDTEKAEKAANAQIFRQVIIGLERNLSPADREKAVLEICREFTKEGMYAAYAIHADKNDNGNFHAHILLPVRSFNENGVFAAVKQKKVYANTLDEEGNPSYDPEIPTTEDYRIPVIDPDTGEQKIEDKTGRRCWKRVTIAPNPWDDRSNVERWREMIAASENRYLPLEYKVDHRSYERQGIEREPKESVGMESYKIQKRYETAISTLSSREQQEWLMAIYNNKGDTDQHYRDLLNQRTTCKATNEYFGRFHEYGSGSLNLEKSLFHLSEILGRIAKGLRGIREQRKDQKTAERLSSVLKRDLLIAHCYGLTQVMELHFSQAQDFIINQCIKLLERKKEQLLSEKGVDIWEGIHEQFRNLKSLLTGDSGAPAGGRGRDTGKTENDQRIAEAERSAADALQKTAEILAGLAEEDTRSFIRKQQDEIADLGAGERAAAKERTDRDAARKRPAASESKTAGRTI